MEPIRKAELLIGPSLLVNNLILFLINRTGTNPVINLIIPILIISISLIKKDKLKKLSISALFFIVGCLIAFSGTIDNFSAISLFVISCFVIKDKRFYILSFFSLFVLTMLNFTIHNFPIPNFVNMINAYVFIGYISVYLFWPRSNIKVKECKAKGLTPEQISTIEVLLKGLKHKPSSKLLNIERSTYTARVESLRRRFNVDTDFQLGIALQKEGLIGSNALTDAKIE